MTDEKETREQAASGEEAAVAQGPREGEGGTPEGVKGAETVPEAGSSTSAKPAEKEKRLKAPHQPPKKEKPEKCEQCGKALSRVKWYYRNNGYYCSKRCWKEFARREAAEAKANSGESDERPSGAG